MKKWETGFSGLVTQRVYRLPSAPADKVICIVYASDFHFNCFSKRQALYLASQIKLATPDVLILGGDYADTPGGLSAFQLFLENLDPEIFTLAIWGNHDYFFRKKLQLLWDCYGVRLLENQSDLVYLKERTVQFDGKRPYPLHPEAECGVLCLHQPLMWDTEQYPYALALAGHLHGSQIVFYEKHQALYPGRWFYRWNRLSVPMGDGRMLISRGLGDSIPLRYNCPRELLLVEI